MWSLGVAILMIGATSTTVNAQQLTNEIPDTGAGYVETVPDQGYYTGQYADPGVYSDSGVYSAYSTDTGNAQLSETDRTTELIEGALSVPVMVAAFFSAMLGGVMAPMITEGIRAIANMEVPIPELPELPRIRRKDDKYLYQDRELGDSSLIEAGLEVAMDTIISAMESR